jgi:tRNA pseudouridine32 synthase/23S rRNA pseudouridine746 synthase
VTATPIDSTEAVGPPGAGRDTSAAPTVLHVDDALLVCVKPAGLLAVPGRGEAGRDCLLARVLARWPDAEVVHRLDMATSGLIVFARGKPAQRALSIAFAERQVVKRYVAVVHGRPALPPGAGEGLIDLPLAADWPNRPRQQVDALRGKPSLTRWRVLQHDERADVTRLALEPVTGRSHQLRVHLLAIGHPIVGDALYAPPAIAARASRLLLHASELQLAHPLSGAPMCFNDAPPF